MNMYFMAVVLPKHLDEEIIKYKYYMLEKYEAKVGLKSPAHITIVPPFWLHPEKEEGLRADLDVLGRQMAPFPLSTHNFSAFKPRTIFIDVAPSEPLNELKQKADQFFSARPQYGIKVEHRPFHPHITIATRDLHKATFAEAWPYFQDRKFLKDWTVEGLSLLRHNKKNWDVIQTSQFPGV